MRCWKCAAPRSACSSTAAFAPSRRSRARRATAICSIISIQKPPPIAPQSLTREIGGRVDYAGAVLEPLDEDAVRRAAAELKAAGVVSIAVCYLFSFMNPAHEERTARADPRGISRRAYFAVVARCCRACANGRACRRPAQCLSGAGAGHLHRRSRKRGLDAAGVTTQQRFLMQSNGGVMPFAAAVTGHKTVHSLLSGPAAGAQASAYLAARRRRQRGLVTLDMGGTSRDIAFIEGGAPLEVTEGTVARRQLDVPALDLTTISAGGGSIVWIDRAGFLERRSAERRRRSRARSATAAAATIRP